jgi:outer membrane lipoprotein-sorting protein
MRLTLFRLLRFAVVATVAVTAVVAAEPPIIAKARAYVGSEAALNAIKSLQFTGTVVTTDPADPGKESRAGIEIIVQKPDQQRVVATSEKAIETTAVDGYEAWQRLQDPANPRNQRLTVLKPDAVRRLRAQVWENLYFYRGYQESGGRIEDRGTTTLDGVTCQKIAFIHPPNVVFVRYFDTATGRLIQTDTDDGGTTREEGERVINGVKFPTAMKMTIRTAKGQMQNVTITLSELKVNETFPPAAFRMPSPTAP